MVLIYSSWLGCRLFRCAWSSDSGHTRCACGPSERCPGTGSGRAMRAPAATWLALAYAMLLCRRSFRGAWRPDSGHTRCTCGWLGGAPDLAAAAGPCARPLQHAFYRRVLRGCLNCGGLRSRTTQTVRGRPPTDTSNLEECHLAGYSSIIPGS